MHQGDLSTGSNKMRDAWDVLWARWEDVHTRWTDRVADRFEKDHLVPLAEQTQAILKEFHRLGAVLIKARQDCSPESS